MADVTAVRRAIRVLAQMAVSIATAMAIVTSAAGAQPAARPNIVLIVSDDHGYGDVGVYGGTEIPTPHIDALASAGVRCTDGYVSAPQCGPTRAGLMTGRYQQRFGYEHNSAWEGSELPLTETTLAERLRQAGYATGMVGKWHLGSSDDHHPLGRGFEEFFGFVGGSNPYLPQGPKKVVPRIMRGKEEADEKEYLTDAFAREAVAYIERQQREKPFFLYLAFNATHGPMHAKPEDLKPFEGIADETRRTYAAMTVALDRAVGRVLDTLRSAGFEENTLVVFVNDNGGPTDVNGSSNAPLRGVKGEVREGGIRVPFLLRWPERLPAGSVYEQPVIQLDLSPTILAAAGVEVPADARFDGVDLLPHLTGEQQDPPHAALYWRFNFPPGQETRHKWAIRQGDWKLFTDIDGNRKRGGEPSTTEGIKLVHLRSDIGELNDLSAQHPDKVRELQSAWDAWNSELAMPGTLLPASE